MECFVFFITLVGFLNYVPILVFWFYIPLNKPDVLRVLGKYEFDKNKFFNIWKFHTRHIFMCSVGYFLIYTHPQTTELIFSRKTDLLIKLYQNRVHLASTMFILNWIQPQSQFYGLHNNNNNKNIWELTSKWERL